MPHDQSQRVVQGVSSQQTGVCECRGRTSADSEWRGNSGVCNSRHEREANHPGVVEDATHPFHAASRQPAIAGTGDRQRDRHALVFAEGLSLDSARGREHPNDPTRHSSDDRRDTSHWNGSCAARHRKGADTVRAPLPFGPPQHREVPTHERGARDRRQ